MIESLWHAMLRDPETRHRFDAETVERLTVPLNDVVYRVKAAIEELVSADQSSPWLHLPDSARVAAELLKVIGPLAAAGLAGDLIEQLSAAGYLAEWYVVSSEKGRAAGIILAAGWSAGREGMRRELDEIDETNRSLQLADDSPAELRDVEREGR